MTDRVTVTVSDDHLDDIDGLVERLRAAGMAVEQVLGAIGVITGSAPPGWRYWTAMAGVAAVEPDRTVRLPPREGRPGVGKDGSA